MMTQADRALLDAMDEEKRAKARALAGKVIASAAIGASGVFGNCIRLHFADGSALTVATEDSDFRVELATGAEVVPGPAPDPDPPAASPPDDGHEVVRMSITSADL